MPTIVDYPIVLQTLTDQGLKCLHYNGGVFGWPPSVTVYHCGSVLKDDPTLTEAAQAAAIRAHPASVATLSHGLTEVWQQRLPGALWILPGTHWAYELTHGSKDALARLLQSVDIEPNSLSGRTDAAAIAFARTEAATAEQFLQNLLQMLNVTDFTAVFPEANAIALLHHHQQIWWTTPSATQNETMISVMRNRLTF